ncbi:mid1-interacting protein 1-B-like [Cololabis saira]|uniref:mid1-interacting protein 1-B-like n=1 Tax=Cololabis saira TaxID=129043 RepID=UPI002AD24603|nr:mid1-interacting protein 1-B-like [Cololabis saira]
MQSNDRKFNKNSLILTLKRYNSAVTDMEKTVLLPSLLRDVPSDEVLDHDDAAEESCRDLYSCYMMLKAIRNTVESNLAPLDDYKVKNPGLNKVAEPHLDPEALFRFHLRGLFSVMSELTKQTRSVTEKYLDIIGVAN